MKTVFLFLMFLALVPQAHAVKYRTYTLAELTKKADAIVVARVTIREGIVCANVLRSLKGSPETNIVVESFVTREEEKTSFSKGETVILFLQKEENGRRLLLGYGDQGKWPKTVGKWPYSDVHVVSIQKVEKAIKTLLNLDQISDTGKKVSKIKLLLSSTDGFDQACALEYLDSGCDPKVKGAVRSEVKVLRDESKDKYLQAVGDSVSRTNAFKHTP